MTDWLAVLGGIEVGGFVDATIACVGSPNRETLAVLVDREVADAMADSGSSLNSLHNLFGVSRRIV